MTKNTFYSFCLFTSSVCLSPAAIIWTGGGNVNDLFDAANYSGGAPIETGSGTDTPIGDDLTIENATIGSGAGFTIGFGELEADQADTVTLSNTTLDATGTTGGFAGTSVGDVNDLGATFNILNGSSVNLQFIIHGTLNIDGTSSVQFRGGGNPINGTAANTAVNLTEAGAQLILTNEANFSTNQNNGSKIYAYNAAGALVSYNSDPSILTLVTAGGVTTGTANFSAIPEPSGAALFGLAGIAMIFRRRK
ncbi:PEP-CTERM sorting domain-containing protein [Akkermansiaceae bacterium]|nr:PEP-CTERM sorting domain-containing protein [Akkermansiaceae bacterium]